MEGSFPRDKRSVDMVARIEKREIAQRRGVGVAMLNLALLLHVTSDK